MQLHKRAAIANFEPYRFISYNMKNWFDQKYFLYDNYKENYNLYCKSCFHLKSELQVVKSGHPITPKKYVLD